jgi:hypothetical protein
MSNGAIMCYRLASELSDRIAAIAPVSGPMGTATCNPKRPVPVMHFHGTDDASAPFKGGKGVSGTDFYSVEHSITAWVKADGCPEKPVVADMPKKADDGTSVQRSTYGPGKNGAEVAQKANRPLVLLAGATGYVGGRLIPVLETKDVALRCLARNPERLRSHVKAETEVVRGDVLDLASLERAMQGVVTAYYSVHLMKSSVDFER